MAREKKGKSGPASLNITSLMDVMTIILVYLLKLFDAEGQLLTSSEDMVLPNSTSTISPKEVTLQMVINQEAIMVDNIPVVLTSEVRAKEIRNQDDFIIKPIKEKLEIAYAQEENMVKVGAISQVKGEIVLQVDKNMDYDVLYKTMVTCGSVGYNHMKFAVMSIEEE